MMTARFMLNGLALLISMGTIASYYLKIQRNAARSGRAGSRA
jgi:hypothetical protein